MRSIVVLAAAISLAAGAVPGHAQVTDKKGLTLEAARQVLATAVAEAKRAQAGGAIAVVDDGGHVVAIERLDGTFPAAAGVAIGKARTAAMFQRPTRVFEDIVNRGRTAMVTVPDFVPLQGGVPIVVDGHVIGAVGVSGAKSAQHDDEIAVVAARAVKGTAARAANGAADVTHLAGDRVAAAFAKGVPLLEVDGYKIHASRRDAPGLAEVHDWETDVIYVLDGTATLVTGGTIADPKTTEPGQVRGPEIRGGVARTLARGDLVVVPPGVPHWFKDVQAPFLYFVVKPIATHGRVR